jgi:hypothetical protein
MRCILLSRYITERSLSVFCILSGRVLCYSVFTERMVHMNLQVGIAVQVEAGSKRMRTITGMIRFILIVGVLAGFATLAILVWPSSLQGSELTNRAQVVASVFSAFAVILSIVAIVITARVSSSDFRAEEDVKASTARLLATMRSIILKTAHLSTTSAGDPVELEFTDERNIISDFLTSTTAFAYWSWVGNKSEAAKNKPEEWRIFFLRLVYILAAEDTQYRLMTRHAIVLETLLAGLSKRDIRQIASYVSDLSSAVGGFRDSAKKDGLISAMIKVYGPQDKQEVHGE